MNVLLEEIRVLLSTPEAVAGVKAVGLIGKLLITPLWDSIEKQKHISVMSKIYQAVFDFTEKLSGNDTLVFEIM